METKDSTLQQLQGQVKQLQVQLDMQRVRQRQTSTTRRSSTSAKTPTKKPPVPSFRRDAGSMGTTRTDQGILANEPAHHDGNGREAITEATHSLEKSLKELRECHRELMGRSDPRLGTKASLVTVSDIQQEQQLYIRVLEEAVHLKASELCITGHEELLVVLAELRHTIYGQEQEINGLHEQLSRSKSEQLLLKSNKLEAEETLQKETLRWEHEVATLKVKEASLQQKLEEAQRLVHAEHMRFREERQTLDEHTVKVTTLEKELRMRTQELKQWETVRADGWSKKERKLEATIRELQASVDREQSMTSKLKDDLGVAQRQIDELKALQDGLLESIDAFVAKEEAHEQRAKQVEEQATRIDRLEQEKTVHVAALSTLRDALDQATTTADEHKDIATQWEDMLADGDRIRDKFQALGDHNAGQEPHTIDRALAIMRSSTLVSSVEWLREAVTQVEAFCADIQRQLTQKESDLETSRSRLLELEASVSLTSRALNDLREEHTHASQEMGQWEEHKRSSQLQIQMLEEELSAAQAQASLGEALAEQISELEVLHRTVQQRLSETLRQNQDLVEAEERLTLALRTKNEENDRLYKQLRQDQDQNKAIDELESELESAALLVEDQNELNKQLSVERERLQLENEEKELLCTTLQTENEAFSTRFTTLFTQYMQFVAINKQRLANEYGATPSTKSASPSVYQEAIASGQVLQILRVFPALVEEYLASTILGLEQSDARTGTGNRKRISSNPVVRRDPPPLIRPMQKPVETREQRVSSRMVRVRDDEDESLQLKTQLHEIAQAFSQFRNGYTQ